MITRIIKSRNIEIIRFLKKKAMQVVLSPFRVLPVQKKRVLFDNSLSHTYSDSPKSIITKMIRDYTNDYEIILSVLDEKKYKDLRQVGVNTVKYGSLKYFYLAMTCSVYITNSGGYSYLPLRKNQLVVNTWHGGGCYKKMGQDKVNVSRHFKRELELAAKKTSYMMVSCTMFSDVIQRALLIDRSKHLLVGLPRNDMLVNYESNESQRLRNKVRRKLGLKEEENLVLFSPTYRKPKGEPFGKSIATEYGIDIGRTCKALSQRFGSKWVFGYRLHPNIRNEIGIIPAEAMDLTAYEDMQELILAADVMINDFSSCMWDFMLTKKPCFTFAVDMQDYIANTQVYSPVRDWPFPKAMDNNSLEYNILNFDYDHYLNECARHYSDLGGCESGNATEVIADIIYRHCFE